jgi:hypothetical protein
MVASEDDQRRTALDALQSSGSFTSDQGDFDERTVFLVRAIALSGFLQSLALEGEDSVIRNQTALPYSSLKQRR